MNKKLIIIGIIVIALLIAGGAWLSYYLSFKNVTITMAKEDMAVDVYREGFAPEDGSEGTEEKLMTITGSQTIRLQSDGYFIEPASDMYDHSPINFSIDGSDVSVDVNPGYSEQYLASLLPAEQSEINSLIDTAYPQLNSFTIHEGKLYQDGTWYGVSFAQNPPGPGATGDTYRLVLHKVNGRWQVAAKPQIVITAPQHPDIPEPVLSAVNAL